MDIALAIERLMPTAEYYGSVTANTEAAWDAVIWQDSRPKPTWAEIEAAWGVIKAEKINPGREYEKRGDDWWQVRFSRKNFMLLCGFPQLIGLETAVTNGNTTAKVVRTLLMAAEFIDVTDADTIQVVNLLTTEAAGNVLTTADAARILQGVKYVVEAEAES